MFKWFKPSKWLSHPMLVAQPPRIYRFECMCCNKLVTQGEPPPSELNLSMGGQSFLRIGPVCTECYKRYVDPLYGEVSFDG